MGFAHLTLATRDVSATKTFFETALGWPAIYRPGNIDVQAAWLQVGPNQELHIVHSPEFEASPYEKEFGRHMAIDIPHSEFSPLKERLKENGAEIIPPIRETPFERFFFRDPNGYIFEVIPSERESETFGN
jgi:catechol 2,3-dioxygenase-like lactoylglutathione lyase family enzyme